MADSRSIASDMAARRPARPAQWGRDFSARFGFDPKRTLTELESFDAGDGEDFGDLIEVHALRHVPMVQWSAADTDLMLTYGEGDERAIWLGIDFLEDDPLVEAGHFAGDLLVTTARQVARHEPLAAASGERADDLLRALFESAEKTVWSRFDETAKALGLDADATAEARERILAGLPADGADPFEDVVRDLNLVAEARQALDPLPVLCRTKANMRYVRFRARSIEIVPNPSGDDSQVMAWLGDDAMMHFKRETAFRIVESGDGTARLQHFAESAVENWYGVRLPDTGAAMEYASTIFGIDPSAWRSE